MHQNEAKTFSLLSGVTASFYSGERARAFFGVTEEQSAASGLRQFELGASGRDIRLNAAGRWDLNKKWAVYGYVEYRRLFKPAANSPIVADFGSPNQFLVGVNVALTIQI